MLRSRLPVAVACTTLMATMLLALLASAGPSTADAAKQRGAHRHAGIKRAGLGEARLVRRRPSAARSITVTHRSPSNGERVSGQVTWQVAVSGAEPNRVEFAIDGAVKWTEREAPYYFGSVAGGLDTTTLSEGRHTLRASAYGSRRTRSGTATIEVVVDNVPDSEPPQGTLPPQPPPPPDGQLVFSDDFEGSTGSAPNSAKWVAMNWCDRWGSLSCNTNRSRNVALDGQGNLRVTAYKEPWTDPFGNTGSWSTARLETQNKFSFTYGILQARIKNPAGRGLWPSFWTTSATKTGWPRTGEIDVMEALGHEPRAYYCSVHGANTSGQHTPTTKKYTDSESLTSGYHVYEGRWTPTRVDFYVDGKPCGSISTSGLQAFSAQQILVGMAVGGSWPGNPDSSTPTSASMLVDWVRAYAP